MPGEGEDELHSQLRAAFEEEEKERLRAIGRHLLELENGSDAERADWLLAELFREAHSLKGAARVVSLEGVERLTHCLETLFARAQTREAPLTAETFDAVHQAVDAIGILIAEAGAGEPGGIDVAAVCAALASAAEAPASSPPPVPPGEATGAPAPGPVSPARRARARREVAPTPLAPEAQTEPRTRTSRRAGEQTIRVATAKLDSLMAQAGELTAVRLGAERHVTEVRSLLEDVAGWEAEWHRGRSRGRARHSATNGAGAHGEARGLRSLLERSEAQLSETRGRLSELSRSLAEDNRRMAQLAAGLHESVQRARLLPLSTVFDTFPRMVRELLRTQGKEGTVAVRGGEIEVDRAILEQIRDPVTHLLRNCVDHGLEAPEERLRAGKPREGTITLAAARWGSGVLLEVADDGAGIDPARVCARAVEKGLLTTGAARTASDREALSYIFSPGFSTRALVTDLSGRGVGLDVVRETVERLHGSVEVESRPGEGTRFSLTLPATITLTPCLLVRVADQTFALPAASVERILRLRPGEIELADGREAFRLDGFPLPLARLENVLALEPTTPAAEGAARGRPAVILRLGERRVAFLVDAVTGAHDLAIKSLPPPILRPRHTIGAAILATAEPVLVLSVADLVRSAGSSSLRPAEASRLAPEPKTPVILVADDSVTTRTLEKSILEAVGYEVRVAADGEAAWSALRREACDLLVADVKMPQLDGFELTKRIRADEALKNLPVVLVTSLESRADRERGALVGADAYIVKGAFDQEHLLETIRRLI